MRTGLFLHSKDICILEDCQRHWGWRVLQSIKDSLGKAKHQKVSIAEYAHYRGVAVEEVKKVLGIK